MGQLLPVHRPSVDVVVFYSGPCGILCNSEKHCG